MKIKPFKVVLPNDKLIASVKTFTENVKEDYQSLRRNGMFKKPLSKSILVYEIEYYGKKYKGIVCSTDVNELKKGNIQKHELTLAEKEQMMIQILLQRNAMVKPVLLTYPKKEKIHRFISNVINKSKPISKIKYSSSEVHRSWKLDEKQTKKIVSLFDDEVGKTMIADGHHRCSTSLLMYKSSRNKEKYHKILAAIFSNDQLKILDFNRVINLKGMMGPIEFVASLSKYCDITPLKAEKKPAKNHVMSMYLEKKWYELKWKENYTKKGSAIDPALFNTLILQKILGVVDVRTDTRIKYFSGEVSLEKFSRTTDNLDTGVGFLIYPLNMDYINSVVKRKETLPPKSSYFVPRLRNGLINMDLDVELEKE